MTSAFLYLASYGALAVGVVAMAMSWWNFIAKDLRLSAGWSNLMASCGLTAAALALAGLGCVFAGV